METPPLTDALDRTQKCSNEAVLWWRTWLTKCQITTFSDQHDFVSVASLQMLCYKSTQKTRTYVSSASDLCQIKPAMGEKCINHKAQNVEYAIRIFISPLESLCSYQSCKFAVVVGRNFWFSKQWTNGNTFLLVLEAFHSGITSISLSPFVCVSDKSVGGSKKWTNFFCAPNFNVVLWDRDTRWLTID